MVQDLKKISETVLMEPENENEFIIFGRSVAAQLMGLTSISAVKAQERIQSVLTSFKIEDIQNKDKYVSYPIAASASYISSNTPTPSHASSSSVILSSPAYTPSPMQSPDEYIPPPMLSPQYTNPNLKQSEHQYTLFPIQTENSEIGQGDILQEALRNIGFSHKN